MDHLGHKIARPRNSGSVVRSILQFCTMKGAKRDMGTILLVFLKNVSFGAVWSFWPKNGMYVHKTLDLRTSFYIISNIYNIM